MVFTMTWNKRRALYIGLGALLIAALVYLLSGPFLTGVGQFLVVDEEPVRSDAVVVLNSGVEWYARLMEGAALYGEGYADKVVINGNRKNDVLRGLERRGFQRGCAWHEDAFRILELLGVPREDILAISAEDAYDTVSEAAAVGRALVDAGMSSVIVTTSKTHTRRARRIWKGLYGDRLRILSVASRSDPFSPGGWWKDGRQIRWVLAEYGAWFYSVLKTARARETLGQTG